MGSTEATQDNELAIADISPSHDGTVFSKKKINFVTKAIDIVVDGIEKNTYKKACIPLEYRLFHLVRVTGVEPAASCSQSRRATICATPGYSSCHANTMS